MSYKRRQVVHLPRVPLTRRTSQPNSSQDEFWLQQGSSGAINAFRQLSNTLHQGGRRTAPLPGGKLQPIFKNHTAPPRLERNRGAASGVAAVLPEIGSSVGQDGESSTQHVLAGNLDNLPECSPTTVRVYLASNHEDMKLERNMLMKQSVPAIQEFCSQHGLYFQLVDLNWGVEKDVKAILGGDREMRQQEIASCQKHSIGPQFVALLGDRYGEQQLLTDIPEAEFTALTSVAEEKSVKNADLLSRCYSRDDNAVPPVYVLQAQENTEEMVQLRELLQELVSLAKESGTMTVKVAQKYFSSALEEDITWGIFNTKDPRSHSLCYRREFQNISKHLDTVEAAQYVDISQRDGATVLNDDTQTRNHDMAESVMQHLGIGNCHQYFLHWEEEGMAGKLQAEMEAYLQKLCADFVTDIKQMVLSGLQKSGKPNKDSDDLVQEVLHHSQYLTKRVENFCGQDTLLAKVECFLRDPKQNKKPLVVHGLTGCGKTTTMAAIAKNIKDWFTSDCVLVSRFLATSSDSASIHNTVVSVTKQICLAYGLPLPDVHDGFGTLYQALTTFRLTIDTVALKEAYVRPLFILLDGIDQLQPHEESLRSLWAIKDLPLNVHIIVSTVPMFGQVNMLGALVTLVTEEDAAFEVETISEVDAKKLISNSLEAKSRKVTEDQEEVLREILSKVTKPIMLKFVAQEVTKWHSYDEVKTETFGKDPADILCTKLQNLESQYGPNLVMLLTAYITASPIGIHERELAELLTCNKDVMDEVHKFYLPPPDGIFHIPVQLLAKLKLGLGEFLADHYSHGRKVLSWDHRVFYSTIADKYQVIFQGIEEESITDDMTSFTLLLHEHIANMYLSDCKTDLLGTSASTSEYFTLDLPQPVCAQNLSKLQRLPNHLKVLLPLEGFNRVKECVVFNYLWLLTKIKALSTEAVIQDVWSIFNLSSNLQDQGVFEDESETWQDLEILFEFLQLAQPALDKGSDHLPVEILTRLQPLADKHSCINNLVTSVLTQLDSSSDVHLLLTHPYLSSPGGPLRHTLQGPTHIVGFLQDGKVAVMFSQQTGVDIWRLETGELLHRVAVSKEQSMEGIIPGHAAEFVIISHYSRLNHLMDLSVWSSETGIRLVQSSFPQKFEAIALDQLDKMMVVATSMESESSPQELQRCLLGVDVRTKEPIFRLPAEDVHKEGVNKMVFVKGVRKGLSGLISIGSRMSKDLGYWDLESEELDYKIDLNCYADHLRVHEEKKLAVCASSEEGHVIVVDLLMGKIIHRIEDPKYVDLSDALITWEGKHLLLATKSAGVIVYSLSKAAEVKAISRPEEDRPMISPSKILMDTGENFLFVGRENGAISIHLTMTGECIYTLEKHTDRINTLCLHKNTKLFSAGQDQKVHIWNIKDILNEAFGRIDQEDINKWDGIYQFDADVENTADPQDEGSLRPVEPGFPSKSYDISCFVLSPDGKKVITGCRTGPIKIWDIETGTELEPLKDGCEQGVTDLYLAYKGKLLVGHTLVSDVDSAYTLKIWNVEHGNLVPFAGNEVVEVFCSSLFPDSEDRLLTISPCPDEGQSGIVLAIYDLFRMTCVTSLHCNIYGSMDRSNLKLLGFTTPPAIIPPETDPVNQDANSESEVETPKVLCAILDYFPSPNVSFFFTFVIGGLNLDKISMDHHQPMHLDTGSPGCAVLLKEGGHCMTGTVDGSLVQWDVATQKIKTNFYDREMVKVITEGKLKTVNVSGKPAHNGAVTCVSLSSDGSVLATGGADGKVRLWDPSGRKQIATIPAHNEKVLSVHLSQDKQLVITGSADQTLSLFDAQSGKQLTSFFAHGSVIQVAVTTSKSHVVGMVKPAEGGQPKLMMLKAVNL